MANRRTVSEHPTTDEEKIRLDIAVEVTVRAINNRNEIPIVIIRKLLGLHLIPTAKKGSTTQELFDKHIVRVIVVKEAAGRVRTQERERSNINESTKVITDRASNKRKKLQRSLAKHNGQTNMIQPLVQDVIHGRPRRQKHTRDIVHSKKSNGMGVVRVTVSKSLTALTQSPLARRQDGGLESSGGILVNRVLPNAMDVASKRIRTRLHILRPASSLKSQGMSRTKGISKGKPRRQGRREPRTGGREALRTTENLLKTRRTEGRTLPKSEKRASDICTRGSRFNRRPAETTKFGRELKPITDKRNAHAVGRKAVNKQTSMVKKTVKATSPKTRNRRRDDPQIRIELKGDMTTDHMLQDARLTGE